MLVVMKFGGSSVADLDKIRNVAERCIKKWREGNQVVVVLSAMGKTTDRLLAQAGEISSMPSRREMDMLLATGEQVSVSLMAMTMIRMGVTAISLNAWQVPMHTTSAYQNAKLKRIDSERITKELDSNKIVVVTGFQGVNKYDDVTTLGRGGSDTTAVALAAALNADLCEIYTDVDGVYTADPRIVPDARKMPEVTYEEMLEFASLGAKVLHSRCVEMARRYNVNLVVKSSMSEEEGTVVKETTKMEKMLISGVAVDKNIAKIAVSGMKDNPESTFRLLNLMAKNGVNIDVMIQSLEKDGTKTLTFTVARPDMMMTLELLKKYSDVIGNANVSCEEDVAKVSVVGAGVSSNPGVAAKMFEALSNAGINTDMVTTSEIRITAVIRESEAEMAMRAVHDRFASEWD
ncbi:aspartate kinase [Blautia producta]|uniref:Aspartokinase n=1 Tax=Blautia producta TaxID=33035 RepID=A0A4P6LXF4_9FIRM|nr:aspartate kinase [Blautia producta]QBE97264.1 Aspartokinase [Blautia producta]